MKKLGLIGGLSWRSTARYYQIINEGVARRKGGLHSAPLLIESLDFADIAASGANGDWNSVGDKIAVAAHRLEQAGADGIMVCANSIHAIDEPIRNAIGIPLLHVTDAVGTKMKADGIKSAALMGTSNVMSGRFYRQNLVSYGVSLLPADMELAEKVDDIVYTELVHGKVTREAQRILKSEIADIAKRQVQAVILACTELEMVVDVRANLLPIYDSMLIHADAGTDFILS